MVVLFPFQVVGKEEEGEKEEKERGREGKRERGEDREWLRKVSYF